ncbi:MAG: asparagine synthase (glutamine-hydrolyzing) [Acidobacteriaceae bacterium]|nr:asparagine synthase (glutamine-hydrolyzing) [Acidobacteriaceae bacterium]
MCGIAGIVGFEAGERPCREISAMLKSLARRGPDDEGRHAWETAAFAHRRLAIIDLSPGGHQPMLSDDGSVGVVFNGCIYNFQELRAELERAGQVFRSQCDTEVLVRGYLEWGAQKMVVRLRGMFTFAIWDDRQKKLVLARDRLGIKPLCYAVRGSRLAFASTPRALQAAGFAGAIDARAILDYLEFGFVTESNCIFENVHKVPPATVIEWVDGRMDSFVYWREPEPVANGIRFEDALAETESRLLEAVRLRLVADVPVSALLSGGIDSTLVCWAVAKLGANVRAFTVSLPGEPEDEATLASETAARIGIPHERIGMAEFDEDILETEIQAFSEPFASYSALGMLQLSKAIKPFATVMLTGDGGDEAFLGYPVHLNCYTAQLLANRLPGFSPAAWRTIRPIIHRLPFLRRPKHFLDYATGGLGALTRIHDGLPYYVDNQLLGERMENGTVSQREIGESLSSARQLLSDVLAYNRLTEFLGEFLTKVDGATMYYAIEARSPFLDQGLWEFASSLDYSLRLRGRELKSIPRELVRRRVGPDVASRPKRGFQMPVERWLVGRWRNKLERLLDCCPVTCEGWIRKEPLTRIVESSIEHGKANIHLWRLVLLNLWLAGEAESRAAS